MGVAERQRLFAACSSLGLFKLMHSALTSYDRTLLARASDVVGLLMKHSRRLAIDWGGIAKTSASITTTPCREGVPPVFMSATASSSTAMVASVHASPNVTCDAGAGAGDVTCGAGAGANSLFFIDVLTVLLLSSHRVQANAGFTLAQELVVGDVLAAGHEEAGTCVFPAWWNQCIVHVCFTPLLSTQDSTAVLGLDPTDVPQSKMQELLQRMSKIKYGYSAQCRALAVFQRLAAVPGLVSTRMLTCVHGTPHYARTRPCFMQTG